MRLTRAMKRGPILLAVVLTGCGSGEAQAPAATNQAAAERGDASDDKKKVDKFSRLAQPATTVRFESVDRAQFMATVAGSRALYQALDAAPPSGTRNQALAAALKEMAAVSDAGERGHVDRETLSQARRTERTLTLGYWNEVSQDRPKVDLAVRQSGYVMDDRMERMSAAVEAEDWSPAGKARAHELLARGQELSQQLTTESAATAKLVESLAASVDRLAAEIQTRKIPEEKALRLIDSAVTNLTQQFTAYTMKMEAPIDVTVRTKLADQERSGHVVHYELSTFYEMNAGQGGRFDTLSSPSSHQLGPYLYYLWTEKQGTRTSTPQLINLGEPLKARRSVDLELLRP
jgi:hypothetical protein